VRWKLLAQIKENFPDGTTRVEVRTQGPSYSENMLDFRFAMTHLVLRALERERGGEGCKAVRPVQQLKISFPDQAFGAYVDFHGIHPKPHLPITVNGVRHEQMTVFELLRVFRDHVERFVPPAVRTEQDHAAITTWDRLAHQLEHDPGSTIGEVEYISRKAAYESIKRKRQRDGKPFRYIEAKQVISMMEEQTSNPDTWEKQDRLLGRLLSRGRRFTEEEVVQAGVPSATEGPHFRRACAVAEIATWGPVRQSNVTIDWATAQIWVPSRNENQSISFYKSDALKQLRNARDGEPELHAEHTAPAGSHGRRRRMVSYAKAATLIAGAMVATVAGPDLAEAIVSGEEAHSGRNRIHSERVEPYGFYDGLLTVNSMGTLLDGPGIGRMQRDEPATVEVRGDPASAEMVVWLDGASNKTIHPVARLSDGTEIRATMLSGAGGSTGRTYGMAWSCDPNGEGRTFSIHVQEISDDPVVTGSSPHCQPEAIVDTFALREIGQRDLF
jgi:hypothetical protein